MSSMRFTMWLFLLPLSLPMSAQQQKPSSKPPTPLAQGELISTLPTAVKDPQAVTLVNQALATAGGLQAIAAFTDFTGTGTITEHFGNENIQGTVTVRGRGLYQFRIDERLSSGERSESIGRLHTQRDAKGIVSTVRGHYYANPARLVLPILQLRLGLLSNALNLVYKGPTEVDGRSLTCVEIQQVQAGDSKVHSDLSDRLKMDFFLDPSSSQIVMMQDFVSFNEPRQTRYGDFNSIGGIMVPFSIKETFGGRDTRSLQLDQVTVNNGLQDSDFQL